MREGLWINYKTGKSFVVDEHERWLRREGNAKKLGVPDRIIASFDEFDPVKDRNQFLLFVLEHAPVMRVRGHGNYVTFEFHSRRRKDPVEEIWMWGMDNAGPFTEIVIVNFATNEKTSLYWKDFQEAMEKGVDAVMRVGSCERFVVKVSVRDEMRRIRGLISESSHGSRESRRGS